MVESAPSPGREFFDNAPVGVVLISVRTRQIVDINPYLCTLFARDRASVVGKTGVEAGLWTPEVGARVIQLFLDARLAGPSDTQTAEVRVVRGDGSPMDLLVSMHQVLHDGESCMMVVALDVSRLKAAELQARVSEAQLRLLINTVDAVLWETDGTGRRYVFVSDRIHTLTGKSPAFWLTAGESWESHLYPLDWERVVASRTVVLESGIAQEVEYRFRRDDGSSVWIRESIRPSYNDGGTIAGVVGVWLDISHLMVMQQSLQRWTEELAEARRAAQHAADHDGLTEMLNRRAWIERLEEYDDWRAVAIVDIDFFKRVNDTYGHPVGDHVLREIAWRISGIVGTAGVVGRLGGEEFAVGFTVSKTASAKLARDVVETIGSLPVVLPDGRELSITVSAGFHARLPGTPLLDIYELADQALYAAKEGGRNRLEIGSARRAA